MLAKDIFINPSKIELIDGNQVQIINNEIIYYGGISYIGECLDNCLGECEQDWNTITVLELFNMMKNCNVIFKDIKKILKW